VHAGNLVLLHLTPIRPRADSIAPGQGSWRCVAPVVTPHDSRPQTEVEAGRVSSGSVDGIDNGILGAMRVKIDAAGRLVIPQQLRRRLGVDGGGEVELTELDDKLEISAAPTPMYTERTAGDVLVLRPEHELPAMSVDTVRDVLDETRGFRADR